ncbi:MAG: DUF4160 domain-containing protein [bacterium]|nr:DUF4160 domain-containing protein [bacterium]
MPTVLRTRPYRFFFYASDRDEPRHVHVERDDMAAKFRLDPIPLQNSGGFHRSELKRIYTILTENQNSLIDAWDDYFGG